MAVQKTRKSRSRRGMRRAHQSIEANTVSTDATTGERHMRHHITADGYYRGRKVLDTQAPLDVDDEA